MINPDLVQLRPCLCGCANISSMMFEPNNWAVVCPKCHKHGKSGNSLKQACLKWNEKIEKQLNQKNVSKF